MSPWTIRRRGEGVSLRGTGTAMIATLFRSIAIGALGSLLASPLSAQWVNGLSVAAVRPPAELGSEWSDLSDTSSLQSRMRAPMGSRKSATAAGVLSFLIPGAGSFYAGNNVHGAIHLGIEIGAYLLVVSQANSCINSIGTGTTNCKSKVGVVGAGTLVIIGNDIWSIFTAVHDAHSHNAGVEKP